MRHDLTRGEDDGRACPHDTFARRGFPVGSPAWLAAYAWNGKNLVAAWCAEHQVWIEVPSRIVHARRRRERERLVTVVIVEADVCGVCKGPLYPGTAWPDDRATTRGHEPPLARAVPGTIVVVRPEHWGCNRAKGTLTDEEYTFQSIWPPTAQQARRLVEWIDRRLDTH